MRSMTFLMKDFHQKIVLYAGISGKAAVDGKGHAGDEAGRLVVQQKQHRAGELTALAKAAHGRGGKDLAGACRVLS